jgi:hypothetical protein
MSLLPGWNRSVAETQRSASSETDRSMVSVTHTLLLNNTVTVDTWLVSLLGNERVDPLCKGSVLFLVGSTYPKLGGGVDPESAPP